MAGYGPQFTAMLLSKQGKQADIDQKAAAENALIKQEQQKQLMSAMQTAGTGIASALKTVKNDGTANAMMDKQDAANQKAAYDATVGEDGYSDGSVAEPDPSQLAHHTGGVDEMTLQLQMDKQKQSQMQSQLLASRASYYDQMPQIRAAAQAAQATNQQTKDNVNASMAYYRQLGIFQKELAAARAKGDKSGYDAAAQSIMGVYHGTLASGIKSLQPPSIPTFSDPIPAVPGHDLGFLGTWGAKPAVPAVTAPAWNGQTSMPSASSNGGSRVQEGATATNPSTGQTMIYTNGAWVSQ